MSFLTRKTTDSKDSMNPQNPAASPGTVSSAAPAGSMAGGAAGAEASGGSAARGTHKSVSLASLYQAVADSQKLIADYLLVREAEVRNAAAKSAAGAGIGAGLSGTPGMAASAGDVSCAVLSGESLGMGEVRQMVQQFPIILDRLDMLGQFMDQQMMSAISQRFERLEMLLKEIPAGLTAVNSDSAAVDSVGGAVSADSQTVSLDASANEPSDSASMQAAYPTEVQPAAPVQVSSRSGRGGSDLAQLEKAFFGELALEPSIANERQYILQGILAHDSICSYLGGVLMMFQSSAPEKMVLLLKDLGEALYRWVNSLPENDLEQFEECLARWAQWLCESAGLQNRIERVVPGQRFDSARHNSTSRGVTVTQVHGWIVLRGNGSVYSKAQVDVQ